MTWYLPSLSQVMTAIASGSMGPKVEAACRFVEVTGDLAAIGSLNDAVAVLAGKAGTVITPGGDYGGPAEPLKS